MTHRLERLRQEVNRMIASEDYDEKELVRKSQELDKYIVRAMKENYRKLYHKNMSGIRIIINKIKNIHHMYDSIRIVDPYKKDVYEVKEDSLCRIESVCYKFTGRQCICENCISMRALNEDSIINKVELISDKYYIIVAIPIEVQGRKLVVEVFRDVTDNFESGNKEIEYRKKLLTSIEHMNHAVVQDDLTSLYNRRFISERFPTELTMASLANEPLSVIFIVADNEKGIDSDQVICAADVIKKNVDEDGGWAARYAEGKFIVCLKTSDITKIRSFIKRVKDAIENHNDINRGTYMTLKLEEYTACNMEGYLSYGDMIRLVEKQIENAAACSDTQ